MYRVRLTDDHDKHRYRDVQPANRSVFTVTGLQSSTSYSAAVMAYSRLGDSAYSQPARVKTAGQLLEQRDGWLQTEPGLVEMKLTSLKLVKKLVNKF